MKSAVNVWLEFRQSYPNYWKAYPHSLFTKDTTEFGGLIWETDFGRLKCKLYMVTEEFMISYKTLLPNGEERWCITAAPMLASVTDAGCAVMLRHLSSVLVVLRHLSFLVLCCVGLGWAAGYWAKKPKLFDKACSVLNHRTLLQIEDRSILHFQM